MLRAAARAMLGLAFALLLLEGLVRAHHLVRHQLLGGTARPYDRAIYAAYDPSEAAAVTASIRDRRRLKFEPHPYLMYRPVPGQRLPTIAINRHGLRGPEWDADPARYDIVLLGGSAVYGSGALDDARTVAGYLQQAADARWPRQRVQVINAGLDGYTSTQERILFEQEFREQADAILLLNGINDIYSATLYDGDRVGYPETFRDYEARIQRPLRRALDRALAYSMLYEKMRRRVATLASRAARRQAGAEARRADLLAMRDRYLANLRLLRQVSRPGTPIIACLQPVLLLDHKPLAESEHAILRREVQWGYNVEDPVAFMDEAYRTLLAAAPALAREGIRLVDGRDVFASEPAAVYIDPVHFSDRGQRLVAERLARELAPALERR